MKSNCYILTRDFGCETASEIIWALEREGPSYLPREEHWHPKKDTQYEQGGNGWYAAGKVTESSKKKMSRLWAQVTNARAPLFNSHVIGDYTTSVHEQVMVDQEFVDTMTALDPTLFDFYRHDKVWDITHHCVPWSGPCYFATLLQTHRTFDSDVTEMLMLGNANTFEERLNAGYELVQSPPVVKASAIAGHLIWRDRYTRKVLFTQPFLDVLNRLGVREWEPQGVEVLSDGH